MKHIKLYQNYKGPKIGDYVLVNTDFNGNEYQNFVNNNVGKIKNIKHSRSSVDSSNCLLKNRALFGKPYKCKLSNSGKPHSLKRLGQS